jgi:transcriptional regulator with XRE-family HTH domain
MAEMNERIRFLRRRRGWSLRDLAEKSGLSASFISQVERNLNSPSVISLEAICNALDVKPQELFEGVVKTPPEYAPTEEAEPDNAHNATPQVRAIGETVKYQFLSPFFAERALEAVIGEFPPDYAYPISSHEGEEFGYVLHGTLMLVLQDKVHIIGPGGSYQFQSTEPHGFKTGSDEGCTVLWVQTERYTRPDDDL